MTTVIDDAFAYILLHPVLQTDDIMNIKAKYDSGGFPVMKVHELTLVGDVVGVHLFTEKLISKMEAINALDDLVLFCRNAFTLFGKIPEELMQIMLNHDKWL
jgi:hypothetical protein